MSILSSFWDQFIESIAKNQKKYPLLFPLLKQIHPVELTEEKIVLSCQNQGLKFYLDKGKPHEELEDSLSEQAGKRIRIEPEKAIFMFVKNQLCPVSNVINILYRDNHEEDGFLYIKYGTEKTFGCQDAEDVAS